MIRWDAAVCTIILGLYALYLVCSGIAAIHLGRSGDIPKALAVVSAVIAWCAAVLSVAICTAAAHDAIKHIG